MSIPVPFGQYVPGDSVVHRIEPRAKIGIVAVFIVSLFFVSDWIGFALAAAAVIGAIWLSHVAPRRVVRGLRPVLLVLAFTLVLNGFRLNAPDALVSFGQVTVSASGLARGAFFGVRIVLLVLATTLLTLTTSPIALTDAIARLLGPFERIGVPATDVAMMVSVAMRFVPTTAEEAERLIVAQASRGARFDEGGPIARTRAYAPVLVPLFVNLFRRAEDLAFAMEARAYRGKGRTRLRESRLGTRDWVALGLAAVLAVLLAVYL